MKSPLLKVAFLGSTFSIALISCFFIFSQGESVSHNQREKLIVQNTLKNTITVPILDAINARNVLVKNFTCNLRTVAQMPGKRPVKLNGSLNYEKDRKFRLELDSFLGPELDIGSDGDKFWFWSGRMKNPGLYWSNYENFNKTKLKTPFNPAWLSHCLGVDQIDYDDAIIDQTDSRWRIMKNTVNAKNEPITAVIYIDSKRTLITGHGIYDQNGVIEASSEIQEFNGVFPVKISFIWHKENASMVWYLDNSIINSSIDSRKWIMPDIKPKINMGFDF